MDAIKYMILLERQKCELKAVGLSNVEIQILEDVCLRRATTTILPNTDVVLHLLKVANISICAGKKYEEILSEIIDLKWLE